VMDALQKALISTYVPAGLYSALIVYWCVNWFIYRKGSGRMKLHTFIFVELLFELLSELFTMLYFLVSTHIDEQDNVDDGQSHLLLLATEIVGIISVAVFQALVLLLAQGWNIVSNNLPPFFKRVLLVILTLLIVCRTSIIIIHVEQLRIGSFFSLTLILVLLVVYIGIMWFIFTGIGQSLRRLSETPENHEEYGDKQAKIKMLKVFRVLMIFYYLYCGGLVFFVGQGEWWLESSLRELADFGLLLGICITFRLRSQNTYYLLSTEDDWANGAQEMEERGTAPR